MIVTRKVVYSKNISRDPGYGERVEGACSKKPCEPCFIVLNGRVISVLAGGLIFGNIYHPVISCDVRHIRYIMKNISLLGRRRPRGKKIRLITSNGNIVLHPFDVSSAPEQDRKVTSIIYLIPPE